MTEEEVAEKWESYVEYFSDGSVLEDNWFVDYRFNYLYSLNGEVKSDIHDDTQESELKYYYELISEVIRYCVQAETDEIDLSGRKTNAVITEIVSVDLPDRRFEYNGETYNNVNVSFGKDKNGRISFYFSAEIDGKRKIVDAYFGCSEDEIKERLSQRSKSLSSSSVDSANGQGEFSYEIKTKSLTYQDGNVEIEYPEIVCETEDCSLINSMIRNFADERVKQTLGEEASDVEAKIRYSITYDDNMLISVLFEGDVISKSAAHPSHLDFSALISVKDQKLVPLSEWFEITDEFLTGFRGEVERTDAQDEIDSGRLKEIVSYIEELSDPELREEILQGTISPAENSVVVVFPLPYALGNHIKIVVPYSWQVG
ncbi:MAG: hypothetical protein IJY56_00630 [Clostridia bacterium]|nr:hypothetical protein [Clostridia bacterium]